MILLVIFWVGNLSLKLKKMNNNNPAQTWGGRKDWDNHSGGIMPERSPVNQKSKLLFEKKDALPPGKNSGSFFAWVNVIIGLYSEVFKA